MKKVIISFFIIMVATVGFLLLPFKNSSKNQSSQAYLRIHVRANSNLAEDQSIKYQVKDVIVSYLTPLVRSLQTVDQAKVVIENNLDNISTIATDFLKQSGFDYCARAKLNNEYFPTRSYESVTLEDGFYDALIVELGSGTGDNWWCVIYPPLCFSENTGGGVKYSSIIAELIKRRGEN